MAVSNSAIMAKTEKKTSFQSQTRHHYIYSLKGVKTPESKNFDYKEDNKQTREGSYIMTEDHDSKN